MSKITALTLVLEAFAAKRARIADINSNRNKINKLTNKEVPYTRRSRVLELEDETEVKKLRLKRKP